MIVHSYVQPFGMLELVNPDCDYVVIHGQLASDVSEVLGMQVKQWKGCRMSYDVGEASPMSQLILQCFTYVTWRAAHAVIYNTKSKKATH